jgi:hypothetical protein
MDEDREVPRAPEADRSRAGVGEPRPRPWSAVPRHAPDQARSWAHGHDTELNEVERTFLTASETQLEAERRDYRDGGRRRRRSMRPTQG